MTDTVHTVFHHVLQWTLEFGGGTCMCVAVSISYTVLGGLNNIMSRTSTLLPRAFIPESTQHILTRVTVRLFSKTSLGDTFPEML